MQGKQWLILSLVHTKESWNLQPSLKVTNTLANILFELRSDLWNIKMLSRWNNVCICFQHRWQPKSWSQFGHSHTRNWSQRKFGEISLPLDPLHHASWKKFNGIYFSLTSSFSLGSSNLWGTKAGSTPLYALEYELM